jgi:dTDP-glucose pyrophosphorylase
MQIIIPMSGIGKRFQKAGYTVPKPLIEVDGYPIIKYVIDLFPGETNVTFICNQEHLDHPEYHLEEILKKYCPTGKIIAIASCARGPVYAVSQAFATIDDNEPVIVNYCDFTCDWSYADFKKWLSTVNPAGAVVAYRGFHPHSLGSTYYGYLENDGIWARAIQEKKPFTDNPMEEYASSGTYFFASGALVKKYFPKAMREDLAINHEFYVSMAYKVMLEDQLPISIYEISHFMQWGIPSDLQEYEYWSDLFLQLLRRTRERATTYPGTLLLPMSGLGSRFTTEGYGQAKPLIPISGIPMVLQAILDLPSCASNIFILRKDMPDVLIIQNLLQETFPQAKIIFLDQVTEGQACSCLAAESVFDHNEPLVIGACDNGVLYNSAHYQALLNDPKIDVIVWTKRYYPYATQKPMMYGWVDCDEQNQITQVKVKQPLACHEAKNPFVIGTFTFKRAQDFIDASNAMIAQNQRINGEFYVDQCINNAIQLGKRCVAFEVDNYVGWGTPTELKIFEYWQKTFSGWHHHPYTFGKDSRWRK